MIARQGDLWWHRVPARVAHVSTAAAVVLRDGAYLRASPQAAAIAPAAVVILGFVAGWRHPLATGLYTTSLLVMAIGLLIGCFSSALGAWAVLGYTLGDLLVGLREDAYGGGLANTGKTWAALLLCEAILAILIVLIPFTARLLAGDALARWRPGTGLLPTAGLAALAAAVLTFFWTQGLVILTRPYFSWHGLAPTLAEFDAVHTAAWLLPLLAAGATFARYYVEQRLDPLAPPLGPLPDKPAGRRRPHALVVATRVALTVFLLAGLMEWWVDAVVLAVVMAALILFREPALHRFETPLRRVLQFPVLPRLVVGAVLSALLALLVVSALGTFSGIRPVVISTLLSLIILSILLPDEVIGEHLEPGHGGVHAAGTTVPAAAPALAPPAHP